MTINQINDNNMNELIKITEHDGKYAVNARELHQFLESKQDIITAPQNYGTANGGLRSW